ncbi:MAG: CaiB/BaiF CoA transferase family protein [Candidatus Nanopelagicales bacterium]
MSVLEGIRVVELSVYGTGPYAGHLLVNLGADVVKVEPPAGDPGRHARWLAGIVDCHLPDGRSAFFESLNRGKRSVVIDLKTDQGRDDLRALISTADVLLHNYRPGAIEKLGFSYEEVSAMNSRIIYAVASGYGMAGPDSQRGGLDYVGQARSGFMMSLGAEHEAPQYSTSGVADMSAGILLAFGVLAAHIERQRTGTGQLVQTSHLAAMLAIQGWAVGVASYLRTETWPRLDREAAGNPLWNHYRCKDEQWLALSIQDDQRAWPDVCSAMNLEGIADNPEFSSTQGRRDNCIDLVRTLDATFATRTRGEWESRFAAYPAILSERVQRVSDLANDEQVLANNYLVPLAEGNRMGLGFPITFSVSEIEIALRAPALGEHQSQLDELRAENRSIWREGLK